MQQFNLNINLNLNFKVARRLVLTIPGLTKFSTWDQVFDICQIKELKLFPTQNISDLCSDHHSNILRVMSEPWWY